MATTEKSRTTIRNSSLSNTKQKQNTTASNPKSIKQVDEKLDSAVYQANLRIDKLDTTACEILQAQTEIERRQKDVSQIVYLGFLIVAITTLGIAIAFLNLVVDVYNTKGINSFS